MTPEQLQRESQYRIAMSLVKEMVKSGVLSDDEYHKIDARMILRFQSVLSGLYPDNRLIQ